MLPPCRCSSHSVQPPVLDRPVPAMHTHRQCPYSFQALTSGTTHTQRHDFLTSLSLWYLCTGNSLSCCGFDGLHHRFRHPPIGCPPHPKWATMPHQDPSYPEDAYNGFWIEVFRKRRDVKGGSREERGRESLLLLLFKNGTGRGWGVVCTPRSASAQCKKQTTPGILNSGYLGNWILTGSLEDAAADSSLSLWEWFLEKCRTGAAVGSCCLEPRAATLSTAVSRHLETLKGHLKMLSTYQGVKTRELLLPPLFLNLQEAGE